MSALAEFHFLRPLWLLALPALAVILFYLRRHPAWSLSWARVCDAELLRALRGNDARPRRWPWVVAALGAVAGIGALAGPSWQRMPQPVFESNEARVIVLDLSQSMNAADVAPSRLVRARFAARDLLEALPEGRFGLVVFGGTAFAVMPLSHDRRIAQHLLNSLTPNLLPVPGGSIAAGLQEALRLLEGGAALRGDLILLTDSAAGAEAMAAAQAVAAAGHQLWVVGVGTASGAPIPVAPGQWLRDASGARVQPGLDAASLQALAAAAGGRYVSLPEIGQLAGARWTPARVDTSEAKSGLHTDAWRDEGRWLVLLLLPLAALSFRRGWLAACLVAHLLSVEPARAAEWDDLWLRPDQQAQRLLESGEAQAAAETFEDPRWRGVAEYRTGSHDAAALSFADGDTADDHYNRGNALARAGRLDEAIAAYDEALRRAPEMPDAKFNRALLERLRQQPQDAGGGQPLAGLGRPGASSSAGGEGTGGQSASRPAPADAGAARGQAAGNSSRGEDAPAGGAPNERERAGATGGDRPGAEEREAPAQAAPGGAAGGAADSDIPAERPPVAGEPWLRLVEEDPGGLLRRKFQRQQERQQKPVEVQQPW